MITMHGGLTSGQAEIDMSPIAGWRSPWRQRDLFYWRATVPAQPAVSHLLCWKLTKGLVVRRDRQKRDLPCTRLRHGKVAQSKLTSLLSLSQSATYSTSFENVPTFLNTNCTPFLLGGGPGSKIVVFTLYDVVYRHPSKIYLSLFHFQVSTKKHIYQEK